MPVTTYLYSIGMKNIKPFSIMLSLSCIMLLSSWANAHEDMVHRRLAYLGYKLSVENIPEGLYSFSPERWIFGPNSFETHILDMAENADRMSNITDSNDGYTTPMNHFWSPREPDKIFTLVGNIESTHNSYSLAKALFKRLQEQYRIGLESGSPIYLERALACFGEIVHLLGDLSVPAHVYFVEHQKGDPYEQFVYKSNILSIQRFTHANYSPSNRNLRDIFTDMANTALKYDLKDIPNQETMEVMANDLLSKAIENTADLYVLLYETLAIIEQETGVDMSTQSLPETRVATLDISEIGILPKVTNAISATAPPKVSVTAPLPIFF
jgi:hypothetical protein